MSFNSYQFRSHELNTLPLNIYFVTIKKSTDFRITNSGNKISVQIQYRRKGLRFALIRYPNKQHTNVSISIYEMKKKSNENIGGS